ncbi:hypothetical protein Golob_024643 [Gossypium lobatum]|uniref:X8 domain-containing protein n=1 Tax=Gossypium lobatum TaxID=34289 RepID=A0A7J8NH55_9ROSI|nr:hypothetical protein [Gossypium lobatum]
MSPLLVKITLVLLFMSIIIPQKSVGEYEQWCIADEQTPDEELKVALDWACGEGGADCSKIQVNQACYFPNTMTNHASYAFNDYFQRFKHKGGSCNFKGAAMITELDPSKRYPFTVFKKNERIPCA